MRHEPEYEQIKTGLDRAMGLGTGRGIFEAGAFARFNEQEQEAGLRASLFSRVSDSWGVYGDTELGLLNRGGQTDIEGRIHAGIRGVW